MLPRSFLRLYQQQHPQEPDLFLVSQRTDQVYHPHALLQRYSLSLARDTERGQASPMQR